MLLTEKQAPPQLGRNAREKKCPFIQDIERHNCSSVSTDSLQKNEIVSVG